MNLFGSPMKIWGSATKIWGLNEKLWVSNDKLGVSYDNPGVSNEKLGLSQRNGRNGRALPLMLGFYKAETARYHLMLGLKGENMFQNPNF